MTGFTGLPLLGVRMADAIAPEDPLFRYPVEIAHVKFKSCSLMQPQDIAHHLLPRDRFLQMQLFRYKGCPAHSWPNWDPEVIQTAAVADPHMLALTPENVELLWEDISY
jgi:hypothetical protein